MGLLPEVAADLHVSIPRAGLLISGYAMGVAIGGPLLAAATVRLPRKGTLAGLMAAGPNPQLQRRRFRKTPHGKKLSRLLVGARLVDWRLMPSLVGIFLVLEAILACLALVLRMPLPAIIVLCAWGACSFSACAVLQARVVEQAQEGPNLASTLNISAFNLGNAFGAGLGGWALDHGLSFAGIPWLAAVPALGALAVTVISIFSRAENTPV